ncbi:2325_t:CDS:2, partial [Acaulospora colombiana]
VTYNSSTMFSSPRLRRVLVIMEESKTEERSSCAPPQVNSKDQTPTALGAATNGDDLQPALDATKNYPNIIVLGETGSGKSSVINMLHGSREAKVSNGAKGETFKNECYEKVLRERTINVFDTVGLDEGDQGTCAAEQAIRNLYGLIRQLENGVNLLVYILRAPRITKTDQTNYDLFYKQLCCSAVPIVLVVTGLEDEEDMGKWWFDNENIFNDYGMKFAESACITATKGKLKKGVYTLQEEYDESKIKVQDLIAKHYSRVPWKMPKLLWLQRMVKICGAHFGKAVLSGVGFLHFIFYESSQTLGELRAAVRTTLYDCDLDGTIPPHDKS